MGIKKNIKKLFTEPTEMRFEEVHDILFHLQYKLIRVSGSHFQFKGENRQLITIAVHNKKVKKYYLKLIKSIIIKSEIFE